MLSQVAFLLRVPPQLPCLPSTCYGMFWMALECRLAHVVVNNVYVLARCYRTRQSHIPGDGMWRTKVQLMDAIPPRHISRTLNQSYLMPMYALLNRPGQFAEERRWSCLMTHPHLPRRQRTMKLQQHGFWQNDTVGRNRSQTRPDMVSDKSIVFSCRPRWPHSPRAALQHC